MAFLTSVGTVLGASGGTTSAIDTTGATLLMVGLGWYPGGTPNLTDSKGNTWTRLIQVGVGGGSVLDTFYVLNPTVGSGHTFSSTSTDSSIVVAAFSNITAFQTSSSVAVQTTTAQPGPITASGSSLSVTTMGGSTVTTLASIDSSYSIPTGCNQVASGVVATALAYLELPSGGTTNPIWTTQTGQTCCAVIAAFTETAGPSGGFFRQPLLNAISTGGPFFANPIG